jgi:hypothetical protein
MTDSILSKYINRTGEPGAEPNGAGESDGTEDLGLFGWMRGKDRAIMLELRKKTGQIIAVGYGWIDRAEFDPSGLIILHLGQAEIRIRGRNLNTEARPQVRLFQGITRHRVPWIQEADQSAAVGSEKKDVVIQSIEW